MNWCGNHRYVVKALGWERKGDGWKRFLIRWCPECHEKDIVNLHFVNDQFPVCFTCLSQEVELVHNDVGTNRYHCSDCGHESWVDDTL